MRMQATTKPFLAILISFFVGIILSIITLPAALQWLKPEWMVMLLIYWLLALPNTFGVGFAWMLGIFLDILYDTPFGEHALALVIVAYCIVRFHQQIRLFNMMQQLMLIAALMLFYQTLLFWVHSLFGHPHGEIRFWLPSITSTLFWPVIIYFLKDYDFYE
jgi:rod shape-determining protein MreD